MIKLLIGRGAQFFISLFGVRLITTLLTPEDVGKVALWVAMIAGFAMLFLNPIGMYINRKFNAWVEAGFLKKYMIVFFIYIFGLGLFSIFLAGFLGSVIDLEFRTTLPWICLFLFVSLTFGTINQVITSFFGLLHNENQFLVLTLGSLISGLLLATVFCTLASSRLPELWFLGTLFGQTLFALIGMKQFLAKIVRNENCSLGDFRQLSFGSGVTLLKFCLPIALAAILNWVQFQGYRFYVADIIGLNEFGLFVTGYGLASSIIFAFDQVLTSWFQPSLYKMAAENSAYAISNAWRSYSQLMLSASILALSSLILISDTLGNILFGSAFGGSIVYIKLGAIAEFFRVVISIFFLLPQLQMKTRNLIYPSVFGVSFALILMFFSVKFFGGVAIPISIAVGSIMTICSVYVLSKRECYINLNFAMNKQALIFITVPIAYFVGSSSNVFNGDKATVFTLIFFYGVGVLSPLFYYFVIKPGIVLRSKTIVTIK